ncbi:MAG: N-acetyl-gamma-glutamyl-phosphate reductase [Pseudomonadota bacterium]
MPKLALIGGRGYTGSELLRLMARHEQMTLAIASSASQSGTPIIDTVPEWPDSTQTFSACSPEQVSEVDAEAWVLALPNGHSQAWVGAIEAVHPDSVILDLGADWRFDADWVYGLTECNRDALRTARRIANPGCYATGAQFGLLPFRDALVRPPVVFGVSGFSGAGRTPSPRNDPARLENNLLPYALTGHVHEQEVSARLGRPVRFHPHVAPFFRGISLTIAMDLTDPSTPEALYECCSAAYDNEPLIDVLEDIPEVQQVADTPRLRLGGFTVDDRNPHRASFVVVLDNLLKGAASQAMQNLNLALGLDELESITL